MDLSIWYHIVATKEGGVVPPGSSESAQRGKTKRAVSIKAVEVFLKKSKGKGKASSRPKSKSKTMESSQREAPKKKKLMSQAVQAVERINV